MYQTTRYIKFDLTQPKPTKEAVDVQVLRKYEAENASLRHQVGTLEKQVEISQKIAYKLDCELAQYKEKAQQLDADKQLEYRRHEKALIELRRERDEGAQECEQLRRSLYLQSYQAEQLLASSRLSGNTAIEQLEQTIRAYAMRLTASDADVEYQRKQILYLNKELQAMAARLREREAAKPAETFVISQPQVKAECYYCDLLRDELTYLRGKLEYTEDTLLKQVDMNEAAYEQIAAANDRIEEMYKYHYQLISGSEELRKQLADAQLRLELDKEASLAASSVLRTEKLVCNEQSPAEICDINIQKRKIELLEQMIQEQEAEIRALRIRTAGDASGARSAEYPAKSPILQTYQLISRQYAVGAQQVLEIQSSQAQPQENQQIQTLSREKALLNERIVQLQKEMASQKMDYDAAISGFQAYIKDFERLVEQLGKQSQYQVMQISALQKSNANVTAQYELYKGSQYSAQGQDAARAQKKHPAQLLLEKTGRLDSQNAALVYFVKDNYNARTEYQAYQNSDELEQLRLENAKLRQQIDGQLNLQHALDQNGSIDSKAMYAEYQRISEQLIEYTNNIHFTQRKVEELEDQNIELNRINKELISKNRLVVRQADLQEAYQYVEQERAQRATLESKLRAVRKENDSLKSLVDAQRRQLQISESPQRVPPTSDFQAMLQQNRIRQLETELEQVRQLKGSQATLQQQNYQLLQSLSQCERAYNEIVEQSTMMASQHADELEQLRLQNEYLERKIGELGRPHQAVDIPISAGRTPNPPDIPQQRMQLGDLMSLSPGQMVRSQMPQHKKLRPDYIDDDR